MGNFEKTNNENAIAKSNFYIITVPTPVDKNNKPDLNPIISASELVGRNLKKEDVVILVADSQKLRGCIKQLVSTCSKISFVEQEHISLDKVRVSTVKRFKGLEALVLILWGVRDMSEHSRKEIQ